MSPPLGVYSKWRHWGEDREAEESETPQDCGQGAAGRVEGGELSAGVWCARSMESRTERNSNAGAMRANSSAAALARAEFGGWDSRERGVGSVHLLWEETKDEHGAGDAGKRGCCGGQEAVDREAGRKRGELEAARAGHQALWASAQRWKAGPFPRYGWDRAQVTVGVEDPRSNTTLENRLDRLEDILGVGVPS